MMIMNEAVFASLLLVAACKKRRNQSQTTNNTQSAQVDVAAVGQNSSVVPNPADGAVIPGPSCNLRQRRT